MLTESTFHPSLLHTESLLFNIYRVFRNLIDRFQWVIILTCNKIVHIHMRDHVLNTFTEKSFFLKLLFIKYLIIKFKVLKVETSLHQCKGPLNNFNDTDIYATNKVIFQN